MTDQPPAPVLLQQPLAELNAWVDFFVQAELPVLRHSVTALSELQKNVDKVNSNEVTEVILHDPLFTLRTLRYIEAHRSLRQLTDITTIDRAIMMIGITPFFRDFQHLPIIEEQLAMHPQALLGLLKAINRARRAARWAGNWASVRRDMDANEIFLAALLHDLPELLMWLFAPTLALKVNAAQTAQPGLRAAVVQAEIYGISLYQLKRALTKAWHLPELLAQLMDQQHADNPRVRTVKLAVDLARHATSAASWQHPGIAADLAAIGELLHVNQEVLIRHLDVAPATAALLIAMNPGESTA